MRPRRHSGHANHGHHNNAKVQSDMKTGFHVMWGGRGGTTCATCTCQDTISSSNSNAAGRGSYRPDPAAPTWLAGRPGRYTAGGASW